MRTFGEEESEDEMARSALTVQTIVKTGLANALAAANVDGNSFANDGNTFLHVKNAGGSPITVTIQTPGTVDDLAVAERTVSVTNATEKMIGPFPPGIYNQSGEVYVDYSAVTSVTVGAFKL
jgi:hypothetical protein